jgi:hypothetical protein
MTITESRPGELVRIKLEFFKPFAATNTAEFNFKPAGIRQHRGDVDNDICMFVNNKMVGGMFEQGLTQMKSVVETKS